MTSGFVTTVAGSLSGTVGLDNSGTADGFRTAASFFRPMGVAVDTAWTFAIIVRKGGDAVLLHQSN